MQSNLRVEEQSPILPGSDYNQCHLSSRNSSSIALPGRNLQNPPLRSVQYTHTWVNVVGIASGIGETIRVFED